MLTNFLIILLSITYYNSFAFTPKDIISKIWKTPQETINKEFEINAKTSVEIEHLTGNISVKTWSQQKVTVEAIKYGTEQEAKDTSITFKNNPKTLKIVTTVVGEHTEAPIDFNIYVPENSNLKIKILNSGTIVINQAQLNLHLFNQEGSITINDATAKVTANTDNGDIIIKQKRFNEKSSIFATTFKGNISLFLPRESSANLKATTNNGVVVSTQLITLESQTVKLNKEYWASVKKQVIGTLGSGGSPITLECNKGDIKLDEY